MFVDRYEISASIPRFLTSGFVSILIHVSFISLLYLELAFEVRDLVQAEEENINVEIIHINDVKMQKPASDSKLLEKSLEIDPTALKAKKVNAVKTEEQLKYEQKLSHYLGAVLEKVIPNHYKSFRINLLIEVDKDGRIIHDKAFGLVDNETNKFIKHLIFVANPVPPPPASYFKNNTIKFAIPLQNVKR